MGVLGTTLFREWANAPARFFYMSGDPPFECFQISVEAPENGEISVHAWGVDTNDNVEDELHRNWKCPVAEFDAMMASAVETVEAWKIRPREGADPASPW